MLTTEFSKAIISIMNRYEAYTILEYNYGYGAVFGDPEWAEEMVDHFCNDYRNKNELYADGYSKPTAEFWNSKKDNPK